MPRRNALLVAHLGPFRRARFGSLRQGSPGLAGVPTGEEQARQAAQQGEERRDPHRRREAAAERLGRAKPPAPANTAARIATPKAAPNWRSMLKTPDALPISRAATALTTAFWLAGITAAAKPATNSGAIRVG